MSIITQSSRRMNAVRDLRRNAFIDSFRDGTVSQENEVDGPNSVARLEDAAAAYVEDRINELNRRHRINERRESAGLPVFDLTPDEFSFEDFTPAPCPALASSIGTDAASGSEPIAIGAGDESTDATFEDE